MKKLLMTVCAITLATGLFAQTAQNGTWTNTAAGVWDVTDASNWNTFPNELGTATFNRAMTNTLTASEDFTAATVNFSTAAMDLTMDFGEYGFYSTANMAFTAPRSSFLLTNGLIGSTGGALQMNGSTADSTFTVKGPGKIWTRSMTLGGSNTLIVTDGATVDAWVVAGGSGAIYFGIGQGENVRGSTFILDGDGTRAVSASCTSIGYRGADNTMIVRNGAVAVFSTSTNYATSIGYADRGYCNNNRLIVESGGSVTNMSLAPSGSRGGIVLGSHVHCSTNGVILSDGATFNNWGGDFNLGNNTANTGNYIRVTGGSTLTNINTLTIGGVDSWFHLMTNSTLQCGNLTINGGGETVVEITKGSVARVATLGINIGRHRLTLRDTDTALYARGAVSGLGFTTSNHKLDVLDGATLVKNTSGTTLFCVGGNRNNGISVLTYATNNVMTVANGSVFNCEPVIYVGCYESGPNANFWLFDNWLEVVDGGVVISSNGVRISTLVATSYSNEVLIASGGVWTNTAGTSYVGYNGTDSRLVLSNGTFHTGAAVQTYSAATASNNVIAIQGTNSLFRITAGALFTRYGGGLEFDVPRKGMAQTPVVLGGNFQCFDDSRLVIRAADWAKRTGGELKLLELAGTWSATAGYFPTMKAYAESAVVDGDNFTVDVKSEGGKQILYIWSPPKSATVIMLR